VNDSKLKRSHMPGAQYLHLAVALLCTFASSTGHAADVSFQAAFNAAAGQDVVTITVPDEDVLVLDAGAYYTQGRRIVVSAAKARLVGDVRIGFYPPDSRPPAKSGVAGTGGGGSRGQDRNCGGRSGCNGTQGAQGAVGAQGDMGAAGSTALLDIRELTGDGTLTVLAAGQGGGKGQKGGKGGTGGGGGNGAERSCGGAFGLDTRAGPGNGGNGGPGGIGGVGGQGGTGGSGGQITVSADLVAQINSGKVVVDLNPATGGSGGDPGDAGEPGAAGGMGGGNSCGGGGSSGVSGGSGSQGTAGATGPAGVPGTLRFWTGNEAVAAGVAIEPLKVTVRFARPAQDRDCQRTLQMNEAVPLPANRVVVGLVSANIRALNGATGVAQPPSLVPTPGQANKVQLIAVFDRPIFPRPEFRFPNYFAVHMACPAFNVEVENSLLVAPLNSPLGAKMVAK